MCKYEKIPCKIIFASTISVYGENFKKEIYDEEDSLNPKSPYAISKSIAEDFLIKEYKYKSWIMRLAPVYSDEFILNIKRRSKIKNFYYRVGNGENKLSLCNMQNISLVLDAILEGKVPPGIYNISDAQVYSYNDLIKISKAKSIIIIPKIFIYLVYLIGKIFNINFLIENSIKLLTNNTYPSKKIQKYMKLSFNLFD